MGYKVGYEKVNEIIKELSKEYDIYAPKRFNKAGRYSDTDMIRYDMNTSNAITSVICENGITDLVLGLHRHHAIPADRILEVIRIHHMAVYLVDRIDRRGSHPDLIEEIPEILILLTVDAI